MKKNLKVFSLFMAVILIISFSLTSFATNSDAELLDEEITPVPTPVNISANYFANGGNSYTVIFSSLDVLDSYKNFNFTVAFTNATVDDAEFDSAMRSDSDAQSVATSARRVVFTAGAPETMLSGKIRLCSVDVTTDGTTLSSENISFTDFTATNAEETIITFEPTLTVAEGPVVPELNEDEQEIYDAIVSLPDATTISFYDNEELIDIDALVADITEIKNDYNDLTNNQKTKIQANLEYNMLDLENFNALPDIVTAMKNVFEVVKFANILSMVENENLMNYRFMTGIYEEIKNEVDSSGLTEGLTSYTEYISAKDILDSKSVAIETAYTDLEYQDKIEIFAPQLEIIQNYSSNKYYYDFLDNLLEQANILKDDITENYSGSLKNYLLQALNDEIDQIEMTQNSVTELPTVEFPNKLSIGSTYTIKLTRSSGASNFDAIVTVVAFLESNSEDEIDRQTFEIEAGNRSASKNIMAYSRKYPKDKKVVLHVYYQIDNAEFYLGSKKVSCTQSVNASYGASSLPSSSKNDNTSSTTPPQDKYDDEEDEDNNKDKEDKEDKKEPVESKLFNDISRYDWASEAIEGLYYAGIINGMEEGVFNPAGQVTREQFCKMAVQLFGVLQYDTNSDFGDVDPNAWYAQYINSAIRAGYVQGQSDEYFGIGEPIMRQDMATILYRGLGSQDSGVKLKFTDNDSIAPYALDAVSEFVGLGIINGYEDGSFNPRGTATRAEAAKVIWGVYQILNNK